MPTKVLHKVPYEEVIFHVVNRIVMHALSVVMEPQQQVDI